MRGTKPILLKAIVDDAVGLCAKQGFAVTNVLCLEVPSAVSSSSTPWDAKRDIWWGDVIPMQSPWCPPIWLAAEDRSFLLYTSGSTGKPKGVVHSVGGYMVGVGVSCRYLYDMRPGDIAFTTADWCVIGWANDGAGLDLFSPIGGCVFCALLFENGCCYCAVALFKPVF